MLFMAQGWCRFPSLCSWIGLTSNSSPRRLGQSQCSVLSNKTLVPSHQSSTKNCWGSSKARYFINAIVMITSDWLEWLLDCIFIFLIDVTFIILCYCIFLFIGVPSSTPTFYQIPFLLVSLFGGLGGWFVFFSLKPLISWWEWSTELLLIASNKVAFSYIILSHLFVLFNWNKKEDTSLCMAIL